MKFYQYITEIKKPIEKSTSATVNKVGAALKKILPYIQFENIPWRFGLGVLASTRESQGTPTTCPGFTGVSGIAIYIDDSTKVATIAEITSASPGMGSKMVEAMLQALPKEYTISIHHDWSNGFWNKMMKKYSDRQWNIV
jgi:hypothetical protein